MISVLKRRAIGSKGLHRGSHNKDGAETEGELVSLLSYLDADNKRLWQAVQELSSEIAALRRMLKAMEGHRRVAEFVPKVRRRSRPRAAAPAGQPQAGKAEKFVPPFGR